MNGCELETSYGGTVPEPRHIGTQAFGGRCGAVLLSARMLDHVVTTSQGQSARGQGVQMQRSRPARHRSPKRPLTPAALGLAAGLLVVIGAIPTSASFPGRNGRIAYLCQHIGIFVCSMNPDGSDRVRLTDNLISSIGDSSFVISSPAWSSDGAQIAYAGLPYPATDIFTMNADGSSVVNLTHDDEVTELGPAWSPSGRRLVYWRETPADIDLFRMNEDGSNQVALTTGRALDLHPDWSPDGNKIAFDSNRAGNFEIYTMSPDGSHVVKLTSRPHHLDTDPSWSPDGKKIAFASSLQEGFAIFVMDADGSGVTKLTEGRARNLSPAWSPDGTKIAFQSDRNGADIFVIDADGGTRAQKITQHTGDAEYAPAWQPISST